MKRTKLQALEAQDEVIRKEVMKNHKKDLNEEPHGAGRESNAHVRSRRKWNRDSQVKQKRRAKVV